MNGDDVYIIGNGGIGKPVLFKSQISNNLVDWERVEGFPTLIISVQINIGTFLVYGEGVGFVVVSGQGSFEFSKDGN